MKPQLSLILIPFLASCRLAEPGPKNDVKLAEVLDNSLIEAQAAKLSILGEMEIDLPPGMEPKDALEGDNRERIREQIAIQLRYMRGGVRHLESSQKASHRFIIGHHSLVIHEPVARGDSQKVTVPFEAQDTLVENGPISEGAWQMVLPRGPSAVSQMDASPSGSCFELGLEGFKGNFGRWYFWDPKPDRCADAAELVYSAQVKVQPLDAIGPKKPDYEGIIGTTKRAHRLNVVFLIATSSSQKGQQILSEAQEALEEIGFRVRSKRADGLGVQLAAKRQSDGPQPVISVDVRLVDSWSFEATRTAATGLESSDVFIYNGQAGLEALMDWTEFERRLGRPLRLPEKSQIFVLNGASPFLYESNRFFALKANTQDPEGYGALDVVITAPEPRMTAAQAVAGDVAVIQALLEGKNPSWREILRSPRDDGEGAGALTVVLGGH